MLPDLSRPDCPGLDLLPPSPAPIVWRSPDQALRIPAPPPGESPVTQSLPHSLPLISEHSSSLPERREKRSRQALSGQLRPFITTLSSQDPSTPPSRSPIFPLCSPLALSQTLDANVNHNKTHIYIFLISDLLLTNSFQTQLMTQIMPSTCAMPILKEISRAVFCSEHSTRQYFVGRSTVIHELSTEYLAHIQAQVLFFPSLGWDRRVSHNWPNCPLAVALIFQPIENSHSSFL